jgi:hypothetical protein
MSVTPDFSAMYEPHNVCDNDIQLNVTQYTETHHKFDTQYCNAMTISITTFSIATLSITINKMRLSA